MIPSEETEKNISTLSKIKTCFSMNSSKFIQKIICIKIRFLCFASASIGETRQNFGLQTFKINLILFSDSCHTTDIVQRSLHQSRYYCSTSCVHISTEICANFRQRQIVNFGYYLREKD